MFLSLTTTDLLLLTLSLVSLLDLYTDSSCMLLMLSECHQVLKYSAKQPLHFQLHLEHPLSIGTNRPKLV